MTKLFFISFLLFLSLGSTAQKVGLLSIDQLNSRLVNGGDTTYVVNLWATWCAPCIKELSDFEKFQDHYKQEKIKVLLLSVDYISTIDSRVRPFVDKRKITNEVFVLNEENQQEYIDRIDPNWSGTIPATLFVNRYKRNFIEKEVTLTELISAYQKFQVL